jgi:ADP-ribose pyrophosphatase YjhB (NUDIX family)
MKPPFNIHRPPLTHCSNCGTQVIRAAPPGDSRERAVCPACGAIHYENPKLVVGCIPVWQDQLLLCKRAIEPRYGYWTLPAGFMENGETTAEGAMRETMEEAGAAVQNLQPFALLDVPYVHQVHMFYRAEMVSPDFAAGEESLEVGLYAEDEIPWDDLAFRTVIETLRAFFADRKAGSYGFHTVPISHAVPK